MSYFAIQKTFASIRPRVPAPETPWDKCQASKRQRRGRGRLICNFNNTLSPSPSVSVRASPLLSRSSMKFQSIVLDIQVLIVIPGHGAAIERPSSALSVSSSLFTALAVFHGGEHNGAQWCDGGRREGRRGGGAGSMCHCHCHRRRRGSGSSSAVTASFVITLEMDEVSGDGEGGGEGEEVLVRWREGERVLCGVDEGVQGDWGWMDMGVSSGEIKARAHFRAPTM